MAEEKNKVLEQFKKAETQITELAQGVESLKKEENLTKNATASLNEMSNTLSGLVGSINLAVDSLNKSNETFNKSSEEANTLIKQLLDSIKDVEELSQKFDNQKEALDSIETKLGYLKQVKAAIKKSSK